MVLVMKKYNFNTCDWWWKDNLCEVYCQVKTQRRAV